MSDVEQISAPALPEGKLLEGVVTTLNGDGSPHIAPMGPIVDRSFGHLLLRPFRTSVTYQNLKRSGQGVLHVTDDVELIAHAAVGRLETSPPLRPADAVEGVIITDACRWYAFRVESLDDREVRTAIVACVVDRGHLRDFFGFNRAKHAVIEAAILATRIELLDSRMILSDFERLASPVSKTGGIEERRAFEFLRQYVQEKLESTPSPLGRGQGEGALQTTIRPHPGPLPEGEGGDMHE